MRKTLTIISIMALALLSFEGFAQNTPHGGFQVETAVSVTHITPENADAYVNVGPLVGFRYGLPLTASGNNLLVIGAGAGLYFPVTRQEPLERDFFVKIGFETGWKPVRVMPFVLYSFLTQDIFFYNSLGMELRFPVNSALSVMLGGRADFGHIKKENHPLRPDYNAFAGITLNLKSQHSN